MAKKQPVEKYPLTVSIDVPRIRCADCGHSFILLSCHETDNGYGETEKNLMEQAKTYYCPYCGEKQKR